MITQIVKSLAGTGKPYLKGQVRVKEVDGGAVLHVQVTGPQGNRQYGYALDIPVTKELAMLALAFTFVATPNSSLAGTNKQYWVAQFAPRSNGRFNMQTKGIPQFGNNRGYGNAVVLEHAGFSKWLSAVLS